MGAFPEVVLCRYQGKKFDLRMFDYLGLGYDLYKGNPDGEPDGMIDPGFRRSIIALNFGTAT